MRFEEEGIRCRAVVIFIKVRIAENPLISLSLLPTNRYLYRAVYPSSIRINPLIVLLFYLPCVLGTLALLTRIKDTAVSIPPFLRRSRYLDVRVGIEKGPVIYINKSRFRARNNAAFRGDFAIG
jgi:hypothetical protein